MENNEAVAFEENQDSAEDTVASAWQRIQAKFSVVEDDLVKHTRGIIAAGPRIRKTLREIRKDLSDLAKLTIVEEKLNIALRREKKASKK